MNPVAQPSLSIVITCYNYARFVGEAIDSVLGQICDGVELIVVDDGSTDESWSVIQSYGDKITSVRTENSGALRSSLKGLSLSSGPFVYFLDADDVVLPGALKVILDHLRPDIAKLQFMLRPVDASGKVIGGDFPRLNSDAVSEDLIGAIMVHGAYLTPPTSGNVFRRDVCENLGDLSYERAIDGVGCLLAPFLGEVVSIDCALAKYRIHDANLSAFSRFSGNRMNGYVDRFVSRLHHLKALLEERSIEEHRRDFAVRSDYAYILETKMMARVVEKRRPEFQLVKSYLHAINLEYSGAKRSAFIAFAIALFLLPSTVNEKLIKFRIDPSDNSWIRTQIKRMIA